MKTKNYYILKVNFAVIEISLTAKYFPLKIYIITTNFAFIEMSLTAKCFLINIYRNHKFRSYLNVINGETFPSNTGAIEFLSY